MSFLINPYVYGGGFNFQVNTNSFGVSSNTQFLLPLRAGGTYDYTIDWGDGTVESFADATNRLHDYGVAGVYEIKVVGIFLGHLFFNNSGDRSKIRKVYSNTLPISTAFDRSYLGTLNLTEFNSEFSTTSNARTFALAFASCPALTSISLLDTSSCTDFGSAFGSCSSLKDFPANFFDSMGVPIARCFFNTWFQCIALTTQSVENILVSIDTSGRTPAGSGTLDKQITIQYNVNTGGLTPATTAAIASLKSKTWYIVINGVPQ